MRGNSILLYVSMLLYIILYILYILYYNVTINSMLSTEEESSEEI